MLVLAAWLGLVLTGAVRAQALTVRAVFAPDSAFLPQRKEVGAVETLFDAAPRRTVMHGNAVLVRTGLAITASHCVVRTGCRRQELTVDGRPAQVLVVRDELALLGVAGDLAVKPARWLETWDPLSPAEGERLVHRYWSRESGHMEERLVTWHGSSYVSEGFVPGMSGSGLFTLPGRLVGVAESVNGFAHGPLELVVFLEGAAGPP